MLDREQVEVVFANTDNIVKYSGELLQSITIAGVDGTFKTVPRNPPDFEKGCLLTFQKCGKLLFLNYKLYVQLI